MKNTIKFVAVLIASALAIVGSAFIQGCGTTPVTPTPISQASIDAAAVILQGAARAGATAAITPPTGDTNNVIYFKLAADGLGSFVTGTNYTPAALQQDLTSVNVPQLQNVYVQIAIGSVVDLYSLYYQQFIQGNLVSNAPVVLEFATSIQDGFNQAVGRQGTFSLSKRPAPGVPILPRPCPSR